MKLRYLAGIAAAALAATLVAASCGGSGDDDSGDDAAAAANELAQSSVDETLTVTSSAFEDGTAIPEKYTCDGDETSIPLAWTGTPADAAGLAVVFDDPDAGDYVHWIVFGLDPTTTELPEGELPDGALQAENSYGDPSYMGSCPPPEDDPHEYRITVYALGEQLELDDGSKASDALAAIEGAAVAKGTLNATFDRS